MRVWIATFVATLFLGIAARGVAVAESVTDSATELAPANSNDRASELAPANSNDRASELAPILVDAERAEEPALTERSFETPEDVAGFGETIFTEPSWRSFDSTAELLGRSAGAQIRRRGGRDDYATLSIRGAPSGQMRILMDGISLGRASDGVVNLADLPLDLVDRIEIYRGFSPASLTPVSSAGTINVVTRDPTRAVATAAVGRGSFGTAKVNAGGAGPLAGGTASAFGSYRTTDGDFDYLDNHGTLSNLDDDETLTLHNNDSDAVDSLVRWRRNVGADMNVQMRNLLFYKEEGVPGLGRFAPETARLETVREIGVVALGSNDKRWSGEQNVSWQRRKLADFDDYDNTGETTTSTTALRWGRPLPASNWFSGSAEYTWEGFDQTAEGTKVENQEATRSSLAIAAGNDCTIDRLHTTLTFQLRHHQLWNDDDTSGDSNDHSTDLRVGLKWNAGAGFVVKANGSSYFRPPTFDELYGTTGFTQANPDLVPEEGIAWDAGFEWSGERAPLGKLTLGYAWFGSDIDSIIVVIPLTVNRTAKAQNLADARIRGHEVRAEWSGPWGFALSGNYTFQDPENRTFGAEGKDLPGVPPHEAWVRLSWTHEAFVLAYDVEVSGAHHWDTDNVYPKIPTRTVHNLTAVYGPFWKGFRVTLEAENLGNSLVPDEINYPLPGRAFYATLSWSISPKDEVRDAS